MPQWIFYLPFFQQRLALIEQKQAIRILESLQKLRSGHADLKNLAGFAPLKRLRVGEFRVILHESAHAEFTLHDVGFRRDVYRHLESTWKRTFGGDQQ